jgi:hypothetical protein
MFAVLWWPFWKWRPVEIFRCRESIQDAEIEQCWICAVLWWPFWKWRPVEIFRCRESIQDAEIEQWWICAVLWWPFWKWRPVEIFQCRQSIRDIIVYPHIKFWWYRSMLNFCGIVVAILKMTTGRNFSMSAINSGHHCLPTYQILMISDNVEFLPPIFYAVLCQPFWKWQTSRKFWKCRIAPLMVTYHYAKFYVSIIIHVEVININVRNFNFPI